MLALRHRAACVARSARPSTTTTRQATRAYASDHGHDQHHHHEAPQVDESPGLALYLPLGGLGLFMAVYNISRPSEDGEMSRLSKWLDSYRVANRETWEKRNTLRTDWFDQAAADRHTFFTVEKPQAFEYRTPELLNSGCPNNVPAGHYINMDHVMEHYRKQHLEEEERKAKTLAETRKD